MNARQAIFQHDIQVAARAHDVEKAEQAAATQSAANQVRENVSKLVAAATIATGATGGASASAAAIGPQPQVQVLDSASLGLSQSRLVCRSAQAFGGATTRSQPRRSAKSAKQVA